MLAEEGEHLAPAIHCLLGPVEWPVPIEDAVASTIVAVELVHSEVQEQPRGGPFGLISSLHGGGRGRRERGHRATLVPGPVSSHTDMVRPQILR